jgi:hypothetical protein
MPDSSLWPFLTFYALIELGVSILKDNNIDHIYKFTGIGKKEMKIKRYL